MANTSSGKPATPRPAQDADGAAENAAPKAGETERGLAGSVEEAATRMRRLMAAMAGSGTDGASEDAPEAMSRLVEGVMATNKRLVDEMLNRAEPSPAVELQRRFVHEYFDALGRGGTMLMRTAVQAAEHSMARETRAPGSQDGTTAGTAREGGAGAPPKCGNNGRRRSRHRSRTVG